MRAYQLAAGATSLADLKLVDLPEPQAGPHQVKIRVRATSLNFRDQAIVKGRYFGGPVPAPQVPLSDGAGEVTAVGPGVSRFKVGDRVAGCFHQGWIDGPPTNTPRVALGHTGAAGMLAESVVLPEDGVVKIPETLDFDQAATLPCAGVTAWNALACGKRVKAGDVVLIQGTGGVSLLALQIARASGARVIATSSSAEKLERVKALGASAVINYKTTPEWGKAVLDLTGGQGADIVVEVGGAGTLGQSMTAVAFGGEIALIGVLTGVEGAAGPHAVMRKGATMRGMLVGSRAMFENLNRAVDANGIKPVIGKTFAFEEAIEAFNYQASDKLFGKVVIRV